MGICRDCGREKENLGWVVLLFLRLFIPFFQKKVDSICMKRRRVRCVCRRWAFLQVCECF